MIEFARTKHGLMAMVAKNHTVNWRWGWALVWAMAFGFQPACAHAADHTLVSVVDFGAMPDDGLDDTVAVRRAVGACAKLAHPCLVFPAGVFHFKAESTKSESLVNFDDLPEITVRGHQTTLVGNGSKTLFRFQNCGQVTVSGLDVDWDPLPFTGGRVVAAREDAIDLEIIPPHPVRGDSAVQSLMSFDPATCSPVGVGEPGYFQLTQKAFTKKAQVVGENRLRIFISPKPEILRGAKGQRLPPVGSFVLALYRVRGGGAFRPFGCGTVKFENVNVYATLGMGLAMNACDRVTLDHCQVAIKPGSERWMSSTVDATHCNMVRQRVEYRDCVFDGMGDDAINVHGMYSLVHQRTDYRTLVLRGWKSIFDVPLLKDDFAAPAQGSLRPGDTLEFGTPENPLVASFTAHITATNPVAIKGVTLKSVTLDKELPAWVQPGSIVADTAEIPECLITHCVFRHGRGCGVRLKTRQAVVENCTFDRLHSAGIWITCDAEVDHESIAARDVTVRSNLFQHLSPAISASAGRKKIYPEVHENLAVVGNRIEDAPRSALTIRSTKGAVVRDNVVHTGAAKPIDVSLSSGVRVENNQLLPWEKTATKK